MIRFIGHPRFERLSRYADGELEGPERERVASHLARCERCRDTIRFVRELGETARHLPAPEPPADVVPRFLARRAAGERVILPTADPVPIESERRPVLPAAAAAVLALFIVGALLVSVPRLDADRSRLTYQPERPQAGAQVDVTYESGALLRSESTLVLRGRYRYLDGRDEILEIGRLTAGIDGTFRGSFALPDSVVYAVFAVEDTAAERVDSNTLRFWELLVHDRGGKPLFAALRERVNDYLGRNWELAYQTAIAMTELYPERVESWYTRYSFDIGAQLPESGDSLLQMHQARLREFDTRFRAEAPEADELSAIALYALMLGHAESAERWRERLIEQAPNHSVAIQFRASNLLGTYRNEPTRLLEEMEKLWSDEGAGNRVVASTGFRAAMQGGDSAVVVRWADRYAQADPEQEGQIAAMIAHDDARRRIGIQRLQDNIARAADFLPRGLGSTATQDADTRARRTAELRAMLGEALLSAGDLEPALEQLTRAAEDTWNPSIFHAVANAALGVGDTTRALPYLARLAADPTTDPLTVDRLTELGARVVGFDEWFHEVDRAYSTMVDRTLARSVPRRVAGDLELRGPDGRSHRLDSIHRGNVTVVAFWSCACGPAGQIAPEFNRIADQLTGFGVDVFAVQTPSIYGDHPLSSTPLGLDVPVYYDTDARAAAEFGFWGSVQLFVLDTDGLIRFEYVPIEDVLRTAVALVPPGKSMVAVAP